MAELPRFRMNLAAKNAIIKSTLPAMVDLGKEMHRHLVMETPFDEGDMRQDAYASVDDVTGVLEVGYDETGRKKPHSYYVVFGTSTQQANPTIARVVYRKRKPR